MAFEQDGEIYVRLDERGEVNSSDKRWDDGAGGRIKQILLWHGEYFISGIQTVYERKGVKLMSKKHGGSKGNFAMISPKKPLTWVSGLYGSYCLDPELFLDEDEAPYNFYKVITSLRFGNDEETYGPFGCKQGTPFDFRSTSEITGLHGLGLDANSGGFGFISAIGIYIKIEADGIVGASTSSTNKTEP